MAADVSLIRSSSAASVEHHLTAVLCVGPLRRVSLGFSVARRPAAAQLSHSAHKKAGIQSATPLPNQLRHDAIWGEIPG